MRKASVQPSVRRSPIRSRPYQRLDHLFHGDFRGVEGYRIDFPHSAEAFLDPFHAVQPLQGRFPHVVSSHVERDRRIFLVLRGRTSENPGCRQDPEEGDQDERKNTVPLL